MFFCIPRSQKGTFSETYFIIILYKYSIEKVFFIIEVGNGILCVFFERCHLRSANDFSNIAIFPRTILQGSESIIQ